MMSVPSPPWENSAKQTDMRISEQEAYLDHGCLQLQQTKVGIFKVS